VTKRFDTGRRGAICVLVAAAFLAGAMIARAETPPPRDAGTPVAPTQQGSGGCEAKAAERNLAGKRREAFIERCEQRQAQRRAQRQSTRPTIARPGRMSGTKAAQQH
jgi:hypothetical protein